MKHLLAFALALVHMTAGALQPSDVQIKADPQTSVQVAPRKTNTGKVIGISVNPQDSVTLNGVCIFPPPPPFSKIADENASFTITAPAGMGYTVRYGAGSTWTARNLAAGTYACDNATFTDPLVGTVKQCEQSAAQVTIPPPPPPNVTPAPPHMHAGLQGIDLSQLAAPPPGIDTPLLGAPQALPAGPTSDDWEQSGAMRIFCNWAGMAYADQIVSPGQSVAHLHVGAGNLAWPTMTVANARTAGNRTSCRGGTVNLSAYWTPAVIDLATMRPVVPHGMLGYYKEQCVYSIACSGQTGYQTNVPDNLHTIPPGLVMIAGDPSRVTPGGVGVWTCLMQAQGFSRDGTTGSSIPANCQPGDDIRLTLKFPMCWDGVNLDSADHRSHMAYVESWPAWNSPTPGKAYRCPLTHPVQIPDITQIWIYDLPANGDTSQWALSSDAYKQSSDPALNSLPGGYSAHGDYMMGWDPKILDPSILECLAKRRDCGSTFLVTGYNPDGTPIGQVTSEFQGN